MEGVALFGRGGCMVLVVAVGASCVVVLLVLARIYPLFPLAQALLRPADPPAVEEGTPFGAIVRVSAPEGETYRVRWGSGPTSEMEEGTIDPALGYQDHQANPRGVDPFGDFDITVLAGTEDTYPMGEPGTEVGAVLFVSGEYATCERAEESVRLEWVPRDGGFDLLGGLRRKATCGSYRFSIP